MKYKNKKVKMLDDNDERFGDHVFRLKRVGMVLKTLFINRYLANTIPCELSFRSNEIPNVVLNDVVGNAEVLYKIVYIYKHKTTYYGYEITGKTNMEIFRNDNLTFNMDTEVIEFNDEFANKFFELYKLGII